VFAPVTPNFRIVSAELNAFAGRTDIHKVTVGVAIATSAQADLGPIRDYLFSRGRATSAGTAAGGSGLIIGARVIGGGTPSERLAVIAVDQVKSREIQLLPPL
jgi:hypothetical protein